ncbi:uncharacterized protein LOC125500359 [Athalia rosae]|uniref:uncharacterized protein LOC125500359 n=1 Tax=Athalia rosae TaxID=37344 RepID=UPI002033DC19|nr:uncharacterized protein LOC125500359 [Athalia rosae]
MSVQLPTEISDMIFQRRQSGDTGGLRQMTDGCFSVLCESLKRRLDRLENRDRVVRCDCGWEIETGYAVAVGLATLEAKRLFLIAIGIFVEWNVLRFSGGLVPLVLTVLSATLGVPAALGAVFTIHK